MRDFMTQDEVDALLKGVTGEDQLTKPNLIKLLEERRTFYQEQLVCFGAKFDEICALLSVIEGMKEK